MRYTLLAFYYIRSETTEKQFLREVVTRMDQEAAKIAQGIYALHPEKHKALIEWATNTLRVHERAFACVTANRSLESEAFWLYPSDQAQKDKMDSWQDT